MSPIACGQEDHGLCALSPLRGKARGRHHRSAPRARTAAQAGRGPRAPPQRPGRGATPNHPPIPSPGGAPKSPLIPSPGGAPKSPPDPPPGKCLPRVDRAPGICLREREGGQQRRGFLTPCLD
uniref:Uncharacterized protein n=1 Tax=Catharus ustulatus TaxID=91951 RepID=A0A8C3TNC6_CATUS